MRRVTEYVKWERWDPSATDAHGNAVPAYKPAKLVGIYAFNPGTGGVVFTPGHELRVETQPAIYAPKKVRFHPGDRVTVRGVRYEVDGETQQYRNPFDPSMDGVQINLKEVQG